MDLVLELFYSGQTSDSLAYIKVPRELYDRYCDCDGHLDIGGGYNGSYILTPEENPEEDPDTIQRVTTLPELIELVQIYFDFDSGGYISRQFLDRIKGLASQEEAEAISRSLKYPVKKHAGE